MFESLDKMVKIKNDKLYTLDPFAYTDFIEDEDTLNINKSSLPMLPVCSFKKVSYLTIFNKNFSK